MPASLALNSLVVSVHYQPLFRVSDGALAGAEALTRFTDDQGTFVSTAPLIDRFDREGNLCDITERVLGIVIHDAPTLLAHTEVDEPYLGVNVAPSTLCDPAFTVLAADMLADTAALCPLVLELTEGTAVADWQAANSALDDLKALDCLLALDDFGAGHSSLVRLAHLEVDLLKIDIGIIDAARSTARGSEILRRTCDLALGLGLMIVAEGARLGDLAFLNRCGIQLAQGFELGHPVGLDAFGRPD